MVSNCSYSGPAAFGSVNPPVFTFPFPCPLMDTPFVRTSSTIFGVLFLVVAAVLAYVVILVRRQLRFDTFYALVAAVTVAMLRALFFLLDPYHYDSNLPALVTGAVFGAVFPLKNLATSLVFFALFSLVKRMQNSNEGLAWEPGRLIRKAIFAMCGVQLLVQLFSDIMRAAGYTWYWINICRIFFVGWGIAVAFGFTVWATQLWLLTKPSGGLRKLGLRNVFFGFFLYALIGALTCATSSFYLTQPKLTPGELAVYYTVDWCVELTQCCVVGMLFLPAAWRKRRKIAAPSARVADGSQDPQNNPQTAQEPQLQLQPTLTSMPIFGRGGS